MTPKDTQLIVPPAAPSRSQRPARAGTWATLLAALALSGGTASAAPSPIVDLHFSEGSGATTANAGTFAGEGSFVQESEFPAFSSNVPTGPMTPDNNSGSVDFGSIAAGQGGRAIDLATGPDGTLGPLSAFTLAGWVNARDLGIGFGGNRLLFALAEPNGAGFDLVHLANGSLRIGINQWPDGDNGGGPSSSPGKLTADPQTGAANWVFFAVTYDSSLETGNVKYYFGGPDQLAQLDGSHAYKGGTPDNGGLIDYSGALTLGNFGIVAGARDETGPGGGSRCFRGLIDEVKVYDQALELADIQRAQLNGKQPAAPVSITQQPASRTVFAGQRVVLQVQASGAAPISYRWQRNGVDIPGATDPSYVLESATVGDSGAQFKAIITNAAGSLQSDTATLTVMEESGHKVFLSFSEGGLSTTNRGNLGGTGTVVQRDGFPLSSSNTPTGPFAPTDNLASVDFGSIQDGQGGRAIDLANSFDGTLGSMAALTVCGWVNSADLRAGGGGNRVVFALAEMGGDGFDIVQLNDGALQLGVNQWPDGSPAMSTPGMITEDPAAGAANWVFFAVTYDGTQSFGNTTFYFGKPDQAAQPDVTVDYDRGSIPRTGPCSVGNFSTVDTGARTGLGPTTGSRCFRGLIDEVNVFNKVLTLAEIQAVQKAPAYKVVVTEPVAITAHPQSRSAFPGDTASFTVVFTGSPPLTIQWQRNGQDIPGATAPVYTPPPVSAADNGARFQARISNPAGTITSQAAVLSVVADSGTRAWLSFSESSGATTANQGDLGGSGTFAQRDGFPAFSAQVPSGGFAPSGNTSSVDFGGIEDGQGGRAIDFANAFDNTLGAMDAFTVCGWLNCRDLRAGWGGNRVAFALGAPDGPGFDLVQQADGSLRLGVNQWPDGAGGGGPASNPGRITEDASTGQGNWVFFAVTYDSSLPSSHVQYYFGTGAQAAEFDSVWDYYDRGAVAQSGQLVIGNFGTVVAARNDLGPGGGSRVFRGLLDEFKVFSKALTLEEIQAEQKAPAKALATPPQLAISRQAQSIVLSWDAVNCQLQWTSTLGSGGWTDVTPAPSSNGTQATLTVPITETARFYRLRSL